MSSIPRISRGSATSAITLLAIASFASQSMVRVSDSLLPQISAELIYSLSVRGLVNRLGQIGLVSGGSALLALAYLTIAFASHAYVAPFAISGIRLGYYMLHNTLQTNATQMTPEARGTAVAIFSSALYLGQTLGVAINGIVFDRFTAIPVFVIAAAGLLALGLWFAHALRQRQPI